MTTAPGRHEAEAEGGQHLGNCVLFIQLQDACNARDLRKPRGQDDNRHEYTHAASSLHALPPFYVAAGRAFHMMLPWLLPISRYLSPALTLACAVASRQHASEDGEEHEPSTCRRQQPRLNVRAAATLNPSFAERHGGRGD